MFLWQYDWSFSHLEGDVVILLWWLLQALLLGLAVSSICSLVRMSPGLHLVPVRQPEGHRSFHHVSLGTRTFFTTAVVTLAIETRISICLNQQHTRHSQYFYKKYKQMVNVDMSKYVWGERKMHFHLYNKHCLFASSALLLRVVANHDNSLDLVSKIYHQVYIESLTDQFSFSDVYVPSSL